MRSPRPGFSDLGIEQLRRDRIDVVEEVDVVLEGLDQLVDLAVAGAVADQRRELQAGFLGLAQEQRDVGIVAGVQDHVGLGAPQLGDERGEVGRGGGIALLVHDLDAELLALGLVAHGDADAVGAVLVDDGDLDVLDLLAELGLWRSRRRTRRTPRRTGRSGPAGGTRTAGSCP